MSEKNEIKGIDDVEIEPLSDEALESVAGGLAEGSSGGCCSCKNCSVTLPTEPHPVDDHTPAPYDGGIIVRK